jgi:hypothetical protein
MKEEKRREVMKNLFLATILAAGWLGTSVAANHILLTADIPFAFYVGDKLLPPGQYQVAEPSSAGGISVISSTSTNEGAGVLTNRCDNRKPDKGAHLVFNKYPGDRYFLSQYSRPGNATGTSLPMSGRERETVTSKLTAGVRPVHVIILAKIR